MTVRRGIWHWRMSWRTTTAAICWPMCWCSRCSRCTGGTRWQRYGWLALRRDQEAACDARVMARRNAAERAAYAALIARYAATPAAASVLGGAALTAPMACPVLGEKSIIHRLRSLSMSDLSPAAVWRAARCWARAC